MTQSNGDYAIMRVKILEAELLAARARIELLESMINPELLPCECGRCEPLEDNEGFCRFTKRPLGTMI